MSGLDYLRGMLEGRFPMAPIAGVMGIRLAGAAPGEVWFRGRPDFAHANPFGAVHGGWYGTLLDSALGSAVMTAVPRGAWYTTLEYKVNITRALAVGTEVECAARLVHAGRSTGVAEAMVRGIEDGRVYATGSTTCMILRD